MRRRVKTIPDQKKPPTRRQLQAIQTKNKIYDKAMEVINDQGYENTTIEDMTNAAGVAKGSFYNYFETKEALILYTFQRSDEIYEKVYKKVEDKPFLIMMADFIRLSYKQYEKRGKGIIRAIISNYFTYHEFNYYGNDRSLIACLKKIIQKGKDEGVVRTDVSNEDLVVPILSTLIGVEVLWCMNEDGLTLSEMATRAVMETITGIVKSES